MTEIEILIFYLSFYTLKQLKLSSSEEMGF